MAAILVLAGCSSDRFDPSMWVDDALAAVPWFSSLRDSPSYDRYEHPRQPAEGTVPMRGPGGDIPFAHSNTPAGLDSAATLLQNPLEPDDAVLARGEWVYMNHCAACHGPQGDGDGPVVGPGRFPVNQPVNEASTAALSDGYLYGITRVGRGLMPGYADRIPHTDRWALVHYLRTLQVDNGAAPAQTDAPEPDGADQDLETDR